MDTFYYDEQIKKYMTQFMAIFAGMQVQIGKNDTSDENQLITVPIQYGNKDRVVAHIIGDQTQNKPLRVPMMSAYVNGINMAPESRKGIGQTKRQTYLPRGSVFPDDITTVHQYMPVPYKLTCELAIYASNTDQHFQILEQILMLFDPTVQIQTSDALFDWTKLTTVELENINFDQNYPIGTERRMIVSTLQFIVPVYISAPANLRNDYIKEIFVRIGAVSSDSNTSYEIIADLDGQGIDYENWFSLDDINLP
jgi:hypothetical protein